MNLKKERQKLGMTQTQFAALINYNSNYYNGLENKKEKLTKRTISIIKSAIENYKKEF